METNKKLKSILKVNLNAGDFEWLGQQLDRIKKEKSGKDLFLTYSIIGSRISDVPLDQLHLEDAEFQEYLELQGADKRQMARIFLLADVLADDADFFGPKVNNIIQVADTSELVTFLKFLILLPDAGSFKTTAVDTLRTNISTVFDAIALNNPYPAKYFNDQQWNQMYLKAAFMQRDLGKIVDIEKRANPDLARIISDYAHERWAASRDIDPYFWRPVGQFLKGQLLSDMDRLLQSDNVTERKAGALCCYRSNNEKARELLQQYPDLHGQAESKKISWKTLKAN
ncbi:EboA domain-containing protein [Flavobacteriaceae bacterium F89]|uniref:EboA domain-containing protein n=1 Tax=Cerina litoralis TaxID=2874477 RepID=A0AAE3JTX5_9FLAO|nr:EboA domain-containing protein [Cerina litoralis]MCG2461882.1 EboA domain-containing protein [Cerina litoralis]